jgi:hypothetical protein
MQLKRSAILAAIILSLCAGVAAARPLRPAEEFFTLPYDGRMPLCDDWLTLQEIAGRLSESEAFFFNSPLRITAYADIRETAHRPNGPDFIPRRYCTAKAMFNDQRERTVKYNIIERGGFASFNRGVDWCVVGLDHYHSNAPNCDGAGP